MVNDILKNPHVTSVIPNDICRFLTHGLLRKHHADVLLGNPTGDPQVENSLCILSHDLFIDTINERVWPFLENLLDEELIPTYSYARLYTNGNDLEKHTDRPSCEVSITIQLGRSHHYSWPFYTDNGRFDLAEGDGLIYKGCTQPHWRETCDGPDGYYSGQLFCHYVRKNGEYAEWAGDKRWNGDEIPFLRQRTISMESK